MRYGSTGEDEGFGDLEAILPGDARNRRRLVAATAARVGATMIGLFVLYALVPVPGSEGDLAIAGLLAVLGAFIVLVGWQIHSITRAQQPILRAIEVVALALALLVVVFSFIYLSASDADPEAFTEPLNRIDAAYYTVSVIGTVGFGDIAAVSDTTRVLVTLQMLLNILLIAGFARLVVVAARTGLRRRDAAKS